MLTRGGVGTMDEKDTDDADIDDADVDDESVDGPNTRGYYETFRERPYPFSWIFSFMLWGSILSFGVFMIIDGLDSFRTIACLAGAIFSTCLYVMNSCICSSTHRFLVRKMDTESCMQFIEKMKSAEPIITFHIECYHYETRYRTVTDSNGNSRRESYQEKVTTHRAEEVYQYRTCRELSEFDEISGFNGFKFTRLECRKDWQCANQVTQNDFDYKKDAFYVRNSRDTHQSKYETMELPGFPNTIKNRKEMLIESQPGSSKYISGNWYMLFMLLGCSACYRLHFNTMTQRKKHTFIKEISI